MMHAALLAFTLCGAPDPSAFSEHCEDGEIRARTCAAAESWIRAAMRPGQVLHISGCRVAE